MVQVSSAKQLVGELVAEVTEFIYNRNSVGLSGEPWGTPAHGEPGLDKQSATSTC